MEINIKLKRRNEHYFSEKYLDTTNKIVDKVLTYRGLGQCFY